MLNQRQREEHNRINREWYIRKREEKKKKVQQYRDANKDIINKKRREQFLNDPTYRAQKKLYSYQWYEEVKKSKQNNISKVQHT